MEGERFSMADFADGGRDHESRNVGSHEKLEKARLGNRPQSLLKDSPANAVILAQWDSCWNSDL